MFFSILEDLLKAIEGVIFSDVVLFFVTEMDVSGDHEFDLVGLHWTFLAPGNELYIARKSQVVSS